MLALIVVPKLALLRGTPAAGQPVLRARIAFAKTEARTLSGVLKREWGVFERA